MIDDLEPFPADLHAATWTTVDSYELADGAARFESWEKAYAALLGMGAAIDYALGCGMDAIAERIGVLAARARAGLAEIPGAVVRDRGSVQSGIVTIRVDDPAGVVGSLRARGINTSLSTPDYSQIDFGRDQAIGLVRISPHAYNTEDEVDQLIAAVTELMR
jgi:selenocysteine lyase/cysteine desulfurase